MKPYVFSNKVSCWFSQGLFAEYIELLVQFGYLSLFSCVYPLTAMLLLINNLTEIRSDAYKICKLFRKPFYPPAANMGVWQVSRKHREQSKRLRKVMMSRYLSLSLYPPTFSRSPLRSSVLSLLYPTAGCCCCHHGYRSCWRGVG